MFIKILVKNFSKSKDCHYLFCLFFICKIKKKYPIGNMPEDFLMSAIFCLHISRTNLMEICRRTLQKLVSSFCFQMLRRMSLETKNILRIKSWCHLSKCDKPLSDISYIILGCPTIEMSHSIHPPSSVFPIHNLNLECDFHDSYILSSYFYCIYWMGNVNVFLGEDPTEITWILEHSKTTKQGNKTLLPHSIQ